jgi:hypothetical protein
MSFGVAAIGKEGIIHVEVLESETRPARCLLSIETPSWEFCFDVGARARVAELLSFLRMHSEQAAFVKWAAGSFCGATVFVIKDDEAADRLFLRASEDGQLVDFTLRGEEFTAFISALTQAVEELEEGALTSDAAGEPPH